MVTGASLLPPAHHCPFSSLAWKCLCWLRILTKLVIRFCAREFCENRTWFTGEDEAWAALPRVLRALRAGTAHGHAASGLLCHSLGEYLLAQPLLLNHVGRGQAITTQRSCPAVLGLGRVALWSATGGPLVQVEQDLNLGHSLLCDGEVQSVDCNMRVNHLASY